MYRYLNIEPPTAKKKRSTEDCRAASKVYDAEKWERHFQESWKKDFPWLIHDPGKPDKRISKMFCQVCRSVYGPLAVNRRQPGIPDKYTKYAAGPLVTGCTNMKRTVLSGHALSEGHKEAVANIARRTAKPGETEAEKCIQQMNHQVFDRLTILFRTAHAIAYHSRPFLDMIWMCNLDEKKGINVGNTYRNDKQCKQFIEAIAAVEKRGQEADLMDAKFISLLSDGSVDVATIENEVVYGRFAIKGEVKTVFLAMQSVARANAPGIYKALMKSLVFENISLQQMQQKIVGFGCDGASVNTGSVSGVITLLQTNISKEIVLVKCLAHRLELAFKDAIKGIHLYTKLNTLLTELFKFYHTSSLQTENLKQTFRALGLQTALPHRVGGTRWVSHVLGALIQVWKGYAAYVKHLGQVASEHSNKKQPKAKHLSMLLSSKELVVFGNFLTDVLTVISTLSQQLQRDEIGIYHSYEQIQATIMVVKKYKERFW
ncbi:zinc finger protein 862-like isoform X1 [Ptychodera flava]|uniref:zinc finger protein 862-like isoform X1 n=1 Tax=Ptychodera flava TaxID=63121 RepID=UPI003969DC90